MLSILQHLLHLTSVGADPPVRLVAAYQSPNRAGLIDLPGPCHRSSATSDRDHVQCGVRMSDPALVEGMAHEFVQLMPEGRVRGAVGKLAAQVRSGEPACTDGRQEGTPCQMFAGSPLGRTVRVGSR
jgi:hypothetical protein